MSKLLPKAQTLAEIYILSLSLVDRLDQLEGTNVMKNIEKYHREAHVTLNQLSILILMKELQIWENRS